MYSKLVLGSVSIYIIYSVLSLMTEKIYNIKYESIRTQDGQIHYDKFNYPDLFVWLSCLLCAIYGVIYGKFRKEATNPLPVTQQILLGFLYTLNYLGATTSLIYIPFLTQLIGRNSRYLMVVIVGAFFSRVNKDSKLKLRRNKVYTAIVITFGVILFSVTANKKSLEEQQYPQQWIGYLLLLISVVSDAAFSDSQAYSKHNYHPTANHLFTSANLYTFLFCFIFSTLSGNLIPSIKFGFQHPSIIKQLIICSLLQVVGQISIYYVVSNFNQHIFPLISTTRKIFSVLLSIIVYAHSPTMGQIFSIIIVFAGIIYEIREESIKNQEKVKSKQ